MIKKEEEVDEEEEDLVNLKLFKIYRFRYYNWIRPNKLRETQEATSDVRECSQQKLFPGIENFLTIENDFRVKLQILFKEGSMQPTLFVS